MDRQKEMCKEGHRRQDIKRGKNNCRDSEKLQRWAESKEGVSQCGAEKHRQTETEIARDMTGET